MGLVPPTDARETWRTWLGLEVVARIPCSCPTRFKAAVV